MKNPNLFNYATSELSQDAFFCWLLSWADNKYQDGNDKQRELNNISKQIFELFFNTVGKTLPKDIEKLDIKKQVNSIDILCIINDEFCIIIEDKVASSQHSDQLNRYLNYINNEHHISYSSNAIIPIYLQTNDQSCYKEVEKSNFFLVHRTDLLKVFNDDKNRSALTLSDIYTDYVERLNVIENTINSYKDKPIKDWSYRSWVGFYKFLQNIFEKANWGYVSNPTGGFLGFWCFRRKVDDATLYLQLEQQKICFKIIVKDRNKRSRLRKQWYKTLAEESKLFNLDITKPKRFGSGKTMTVAILDNHLLQNDQKMLDLEGFMETMKTLEKFVSHCSNKFAYVQV